MDILTADLCDEFPGEVEVVDAGLSSYGGLRRFHGAIDTVVVFEDNVLVKQAVAENGNGRVLVIDGGGSGRRALVGDRVAATAAENGWAGIVVNGCIRDSVAIADIEIGVLAIGTCPVASHKHGEGRRTEMLRFAGVSFTPGHHLYADEDGVIVASRHLLARN